MADPLLLELEFARAKDAADPYAFRWGLREYIRVWDKERVQPASLAWTDTLSADLAALARPDPPPEHLQRLGEALRAFADAAGFREEEPALLRALAEQRPVSLILRFHAAELFALPWEALPIGPDRVMLGRLPGVLLRYAWPGVKAQPPSPNPRPASGRVLLAWSAALGEVDAGAHQQALSEAARLGELPFGPEGVLAHCSLATLSQTLREAQERGDPVVALHLLAHGVALSGGGFGLALDGPEGAESIDGPTLAGALAPFAPSLRLIVLSACSSGDSGPLGSKLGSLAQALHREGFEAVLASRLPLSMAGSAILARSLWKALLVDLLSLEDATRLSRQALAQGPSPIDAVALQLHGAAGPRQDTRPLIFRPYRGLLPFRREHRRFFFGRQAEVREVIEDLRGLCERKDPAHPPFLLVVGASGTGKSSLVLSGVLPELQADPRVKVLVMRPGSAPELALDKALQAVGPLGEAPLLVLDQLEELFTQGTPDTDQSQFLQRIWSLAQQGCRVIATLRVDWLSRCASLRLQDGRSLEQIAYDEHHRVFIAQLAGEPLRQAITLPAQRVGLVFEEGLAERIYEEVRQEPGALPLMQHAMDLLWMDRSDDTLTHQAREQLGGVIGALQHEADRVVTALSPEQHILTRRLFLRLVRYVGELDLSTRKRVALSELRPTDPQRAARLDETIALLVDHRLLVRDEGEGGQTTLEIAHEALIRRWSTLRDWLEQDWERAQAVDRLSEWVAERVRSPTFLLREEQLSAALRTRAAYGDELNAEMLDLIARSEAAESAARLAEETQKRRERRLTRGLVYGGLIFFAVGLVQFVQVQRAKQDADEKTQEAKEQSELADAATRRADRAKKDAEKAEADAEAAKADAGRAEADAERALAKAEKAEGEAEAALSLAHLAQREAKRSQRDAVLAREAASKAEAEAKTALAELELAKKEADLALRLRVANALLQEDPTEAAALLVEQQDAQDKLAWRRLALSALTHPVARWVVDAGDSSIVDVMERPDGSVVIAATDGSFTQWRPGEGPMALQGMKCDGPALKLRQKEGVAGWLAQCRSGQAWFVSEDLGPLPLHRLDEDQDQFVDAAWILDSETLVLSVGTNSGLSENQAETEVTSIGIVAQDPYAPERSALLMIRIGTSFLALHSLPNPDQVLVLAEGWLGGRDRLWQLDLSDLDDETLEREFALHHPRTRLRTRQGLTALTVSEHGLAALALQDGRVQADDMTRRARARTLTQHETAASALAFVGDAVLSAGDDGLVRLTGLGRNDVSTVFSGYGVVGALAADPEGAWFAVGQNDGLVWVESIPDAQLTAHGLRGHLDAVDTLYFSGDTDLLYSGSRDGVMRVWPEPSLQAQQRLPSTAGAVTGLSWGSEGPLITTQDRRIWGCTAPTCSSPQVLVIPTPVSSSRGLVHALWMVSNQIPDPTADSPSLIQGESELRVTPVALPLQDIWILQHRRAGGVWTTLDVSFSALTHLSLNEDETRLLAQSVQGIVTVYDLSHLASPSAMAPGQWSRRKARRAMQTQPDPWTLMDTAYDPSARFATDPDAELLLIYGDEARTRLYEVATGKPLRAAALPDRGEVSDAVFSAKGGLIALRSSTGALSVWDPIAQSYVFNVQPGSGTRTMTWLGEDALLTGSQSGELLLWPLDGGAPVAIGRLDYPVAQIVVSPDQRFIAAFGAPGGAELYLLPDDGGPAQALGLPRTEGWVSAFLFSPDSEWLYIGTDLGEIVSIQTDWALDPMAALQEATRWCVPARDRVELLGESEEQAAAAEAACAAQR